MENLIVDLAGRPLLDSDDAALGRRDAPVLRMVQALPVMGQELAHPEVIEGVAPIGRGRVYVPRMVWASPGR